jgi:hypothetical protein
MKKLTDMSADMAVALNRESFLKASDDKLFRCHCDVATNHNTKNFHRTDSYDGKIILSVLDLTRLDLKTLV